EGQRRCQPARGGGLRSRHYVRPQRRTTPAVAVGPGIPSLTKEGNFCALYFFTGANWTVRTVENSAAA
ncbi:MAG: hypothetical protein L0338_35475, partial [Acidobacteria bacterium]|nr:hypothetical protein [Acidobacteriota bacterium]